MVSTVTTEPMVQQSKKRLKQRFFRTEADDTLPITIRHERIYILPTGRGMAFLGVVSIMLLASMNYRLNLGYALSFILVGLLASTLLSTYLNLVKLTFSGVLAKDTFSGTPLNFEVTLTEPGHRTRHSIEIAVANDSDRIDIRRGQSANATLVVKSPPRGVHALGRITLSSDFPLGLWRGWGYVHPEAAGYVYPKPEIPVAPLSSARCGDAGARRRSEEKEFKELRVYRETDNPASIAWKTVARGGQWYTKEFEQTESDNCDVSIRWADTDSSLTHEQRLSRMSAWLVEAHKKSLPYDFQLPGFSYAGSQRQSNRQQTFLRRLAMFDTDNSIQ